MNNESPKADELAHAHERQIDAAMISYPVVSPPAAFTQQVMARVCATPPAPQQLVAPPVPTGIVQRFLRLYGVEFATATVITLLVGFGFVWLFFAQMAPLPDVEGAIRLSAVSSLRPIAPYITSHYFIGLMCALLIESALLLLAWVRWIEPSLFDVE